MRRNPVTGIVASVVTLLCVVWLFFYYTRPPEFPPYESWYYDMGTNELYGAPGQGFPPKEAPSGAEGVKAKVYAVNDCSDPKDRFIAYIWKFTPEGQHTMYTTFDIAVGQYTSATQMLVRRLDEDEWTLRSPEERKEIVDEEREKRDAAELKHCGKYE